MLLWPPKGVMPSREAPRGTLDTVPCGLFCDLYLLTAMQPTYRPSRIARARKCGFRARSRTRGGRKVLQNRRRTGRKYLTKV